MKAILWSFAFFALLAAPSAALAKPSAGQCKKMWHKQPGERVLRCTPRGGARRTNSLAGRRYIRSVGTCWNYDVVVQQSCGCRLFSKASICCWNKGRGCPDFRVGSSRLVDCRKYGAPRFGESGRTLSEACKAKAATAAKHAHCRKGAFKAVALGDCRDAINVSCDTPAHFNALLRETCGPRVEDCPGCQLSSTCSSARGLVCYEKMLQKKAAKQSRGAGPDAAKLSALFATLNAGLRSGNEAAFRGGFYPEAYTANLVGMTGRSGQAFFKELQRAGLTLRPKKPQKIHGYGMPALVPCAGYSLKKAREWNAYSLVVVSTKKGYKVLGVGDKSSLLDALGLRWIKEKRGKK